jgi:tetratricopeptide (TPR) repeat protein
MDLSLKILNALKTLHSIKLLLTNKLWNFSSLLKLQLIIHKKLLTMRHIFIITLLFVQALSLKAQNLDAEIGFMFVKAEYLMDTDRIEEALKELNEIVNKDATYKNALYLRAMAKYKLASYRGAKADILQFMDLNGVSKEAVSLMAKSDYALKRWDAALVSIESAIAMGEKDEKLHEMRGQIYYDKGEMIKACQSWEAGAKAGSTNAAVNAKKYCGYNPEAEKEKSRGTKTIPRDETSENSEGGHTEVDPSGNNTETEDEDIDDEDMDDEDMEEEEVDENMPPEDNTVNNIEIDEELTIEIFGQGLGKRDVIDMPSILILSEVDGTVAVEICVDDRGKVSYAEFAPGRSTIAQNSLVSLALRKAKEFWFEPSEYEKMCGFMLFKVKAL